MAQALIHAEPQPQGVRFEVRRKLRFGQPAPVPVDAWLALDDSNLVMPVAHLLAWRDEGRAAAEGVSVIVPHELIADLSDREAAALRLPPPPPLALHLQHDGTIDQPSFTLRAGWRTTGGQPVLGARRVGAWLTVGSHHHRLPRLLYALVEAVDGFRTVASGDEAGRWRAWQRVQDLLPREPTGEVRADAYLTSFVVAHAGTFSLRPFVSADGFDVDPVLFGPVTDRGDGAELAAGLQAEPTPLLPAELQEVFARQRFREADRCRPRYLLRGGYYLVLDPDLENALTVVRRVQAGDRATRRAFACNPRAALAEALGGNVAEAELERLFVETAEYSDRVRDLGLWQPPVLPWIQRQAASWLPDDPGTWPRAGLLIDGKRVELRAADIPALRESIARAMAAGQPSIPFRDLTGEVHQIPATGSTRAALGELPVAASPPQPPADDGRGKAAPAAPTVLQIEENLEALGYERAAGQRSDHGADALPAAVVTPLKPHQAAGLAWLQRAWCHGEPGALLADDMGLGKTLQCLAFLEWIARAQTMAGRRRPGLVVAPTGLLRNWEAEHDRHLRPPGLGAPCRLWGDALKSLRREPGAEVQLGRSVLDLERIRAAAWVLTTYETLRDYHLSLAAVPFAIAVFDEAQKIKNPGSLVTWTAKAVNADFVLALTGTPIENRLADLWSITDRAHPGLLRDLKWFSASFERPGADAEKLGRLKRWLVDDRRAMAAAPARPAFMLRRMKADQLEGLPDKREELRQAPMPPEQADAYRRAIATARGGRKGAMLKALQGLRATSLHPGTPADAMADPDGFITRSARWTLTFAILDEIARPGDKALVFLETQALQPVLAGLVRRRFQLHHLPMIINGAVAGPERQTRVDAFQKGAPGFDLLILGPRAAGIGLTLTAANHIIHLTRWWNPAVEDQCTDRAYRIGQTKPVTVWLPQAIFPEAPERSFDRQLHALLDRKRILSRDMLAPPAATDRDAEDLFNATVGG